MVCHPLCWGLWTKENASHEVEAWAVPKQAEDSLFSPGPLEEGMGFYKIMSKLGVRKEE
jgi:hypothetical protein